MAMGVRSAVMGSLHTAQFAWYSAKSPVAKAKELGTLLRLVMDEELKHGMMFKQRKRGLMKVDDLVVQWIDATVGMCMAHDKDEYDAHDAKADALLGPLLSAPIAEIREFYVKLCAAMEADKRVPWLVKLGFEAWGEVMVKDAPDEKIKRLKNKLAAEIAELVEEPIRDQIPNAVKRALRWRDPETLQAVKEVLESGVKPKLRGRESCLFLELTPKGKGKKISVML